MLRSWLDSHGDDRLPTPTTWRWHPTDGEPEPIVTVADAARRGCDEQLLAYLNAPDPTARLPYDGAARLPLLDVALAIDAAELAALDLATVKAVEIVLSARTETVPAVLALSIANRFPARSPSAATLRSLVPPLTPAMHVLGRAATPADVAGAYAPEREAHARTVTQEHEPKIRIAPKVIRLGGSANG